MLPLEEMSQTQFAILGYTPGPSDITPELVRVDGAHVQTPEHVTFAGPLLTGAGVVVRAALVDEVVGAGVVLVVLAALVDEVVRAALVDEVVRAALVDEVDVVVGAGVLVLVHHEAVNPSFGRALSAMNST